MFDPLNCFAALSLLNLYIFLRGQLLQNIGCVLWAFFAEVFPKQLPKASSLRSIARTTFFFSRRDATIHGCFQCLRSKMPSTGLLELSLCFCGRRPRVSTCWPAASNMFSGNSMLRSAVKFFFVGVQKGAHSKSKVSAGAHPCAPTETSLAPNGWQLRKVSFFLWVPWASCWTTSVFALAALFPPHFL